MSRAKKGAASEGKAPAPQDEAAVNTLSVVQLREMFEKLLDEKVQGPTEESKKISDRLQAQEQQEQRQQQQQQRFPARNTGPQDKFGE